MIIYKSILSPKLFDAGDRLSSLLCVNAGPVKNTYVCLSRHLYKGPMDLCLSGIY